MATYDYGWGGGDSGAWDQYSTYQGDTSGLQFSPNDQSLWYDPNQNYDWGYMDDPYGSGLNFSPYDTSIQYDPNQSYYTDQSGGGSNWMNLLSSPQALSMIGGGLLSSIGPTQTGTQVITQAPWEAQQPYLRDLFAKAQGAMQTSLGMSPQEETALGAMEARARMGSPVQAMGTGTAMGILSGLDANPYYGVNNPYLSQTIDAASEDAMRQLRPMFAAQQRASGSFGNTGLSESQTRTAAQTLGNIATGARMQDYTQQQQLGESDVNRRMNLALQSPALAQQDYADIERLYNVGQTRRYDPYATLGKYGSLIQGQYGGVTSSPIYQNRAAEMLGGGLLGLQAYNQLSGSR